jgi:molecular chaperone GrpE (heat shock protein)
MTPTERKTFSFWAKPNFARVVKTNNRFRYYYNGALLYAHYEKTYADLKKETVRYAKRVGMEAEVQDALKDIPDIRFSVIGKYHYILNNNGEVPDDVLAGLDPYLHEIIQTAKDKALRAEQAAAAAADKPTAPKATVQDRIKERASAVAADIGQWVDDIYTAVSKAAPQTRDFVAFFKENDLKAPHMNHIQNSFAYSAAELRELVETKDRQLQEGYSHVSKSTIKTLLEFYTNLETACELLKDVAKAERAPRAKRAVSADRLVSKLRYRKEDVSLGVASITPTALLGAKEVWVYNTKTRKLSRYISDEHQGPITVRGTVLDGFDQVKSLTKTLRKPAEQLAQFKKSSKVQLRSFMNTVTTVDTPATGRINEDCILLRADK